MATNEIKEQKGQEPNINEQTFTDIFNQTTINNLYRTLKSNSTTPTGTPRSFKEQFWLYKNGSVYKLYVYIDGVWTEIGSGNMTQDKGTSLPTASTNTDKYYYLTTTDTLYRSNGVSWIALN